MATPGARFALPTAIIQALTEGIHARFPEAEVSVRLTRGLCSYYAEQGGILIGYEG